jgi:hypothetical protein
MTVETLPVQLDVPKEGKEVVDFVFAVTQFFLDKRPLEELVTLVGPMLTAIDGWENLSDEVKSAYRADLSAYLTKKGLDTLLPVEQPE